MKIKTKIICVTGIVLICVVVVSSVSIWTLNEISRLKETIDDGVELIGRARTIHSLMKDLMFDIFTPQTYRLLKDIIYTPRFQTTRRSFHTAVEEFQGEFNEFMESPRVKRLLRDEELQDTYTVAQVISGKAFIKIEDFQSKLDQLAGLGVLGEESLYEQVQIGAETTIPLFFDEVRDTSYYLTNSFESFLSHFIRSLEDQSSIIRRRILIFFWSITVVIGIFLIGFLKFGMGLINVPGKVMNIVIGFLLIFAIMLPGYVKALHNRSLLKRQRAMPGHATTRSSWIGKP